MWYALQVATGQELELWHRIETEAKRKGVSLEKVLACVKHITELGDEIRHSYEKVIPGYIFVRTHGNMTNAIYQVLRHIPGVFKVFYESPLTEEEIRHVFALTEGEVVVSAEKVANFSRTKLMEQFRRFKERMAQPSGIKVLFRRMQLYFRIPSTVIKNVGRQLKTASRPDLLTLICLMVT